MDPPQRELLRQSFLLLGFARKNQDKLHDYSFVVMPAAKAYEGYLKKWLFTLRFIDEEAYKKDSFRLGKALNPELENRYPEDCLYNEITRATSPGLADELWQTWKKGRNRLLHYFPGEQQIFSLDECEERLDMIVLAVRNSFKAGKINNR